MKASSEPVLEVQNGKTLIYTLILANSLLKINRVKAAVCFLTHKLQNKIPPNLLSLSPPTRENRKSGAGHVVVVTLYFPGCWLHNDGFCITKRFFKNSSKMCTILILLYECSLTKDESNNI